MRTVFSSHNECAHIWASQSQYEGRASRVFFEGEIIYSYGRHFPVARFAPEFGDIVLFTNRGYSNSTSKHKSVIRAAIPNTFEIVYCEDPTRSVEHNLDRWKYKLSYFREQFAASNRKPSRAKIVGEIFQEIEAARRFCDALNIPCPDCFEYSSDEADALRYGRAAAKRREELSEQRAIDRDKKRKLEAAERFELWQAGENVYTTSGFDLYPTALRIKNDEIQTSRGANIPVADAVRIYPLLDRARSSGKTIEAGLSPLRLGAYEFRSFDGNTLVVGCHSIAWDQIEKMAIQLNLMEG